MDSGSISDFTDAIGGASANMDRFYSQRVNRCTGVVSFDTTTNGTYSDVQGLAEWLSKNKDNELLKQIKTGLATDMRGIPLAMHHYPATLSDLDTVRALLDDVRRYGREDDCIFAMDRGFVSGSNVRFMLDMGLSFVAPAVTSSKDIKRLLTEVKAFRKMAGKAMRYFGVRADGRKVSLTVKNVLFSKSHSEYRNPLLVEVMFRFGFVDYIGSGMKRMFMTQVDRYFPLPEYEIDDDHVLMEITGHPINETYRYILHNNPDLPLETIFILDEVQKGKEITDDEAKVLRDLGFLSGRAPQYSLQRDKPISKRSDGTKYESLKMSIVDYLSTGKETPRRDIELEMIQEGHIGEGEAKGWAMKYVLGYLVKSGVIENIGSNKSPVYRLVEHDKE
jgi:hypothetical protein